MSDSQFLNMPEGENKVWVTAIKFERGTNDKPRNKFRITLAEQPSSVSHTAPYTNQDVYLPMSSDSTPAKIAMERRVKAILYPLAGFEADKKTTLKELFAGIEANLANHDLSADVLVQHREGNMVDRNTGNNKIFIEVLSIKATGFADKVAYESSIADDMDDSGDGSTPF
jgi:hypothetical protein